MARFHHAGFIFILLIPIILLATPGSVSQKVNALLNLTTMPIFMVLYTLALAQKEEQQWKTVKK